MKESGRNDCKIKLNFENKRTLSMSWNKMKFAIDSLLTSDSTEASEPNFKLTECSPDVGVIMSGQGGICAKCNTMFKSKISLSSHLLRCSQGQVSESESGKDSGECCGSSSESNESGESTVPRLIIMQQK